MDKISSLIPVGIYSFHSVRTKIGCIIQYNCKVETYPSVSKDISKVDLNQGSKD
jgi:hypothetical protein